MLMKERYKEALDRATKAKNLNPDWDFMWQAHSIAGKALYHLGNPEEALVSLREAEKILAPKLLEPDGSEYLLNVLFGITWYIDRIDPTTHNNRMQTDRPKPASRSSVDR